MSQWVIDILLLVFGLMMIGLLGIILFDKTLNYIYKVDNEIDSNKKIP